MAGNGFILVWDENYIQSKSERTRYGFVTSTSHKIDLWSPEQVLAHFEVCRRTSHCETVRTELLYSGIEAGEGQ